MPRVLLLAVALSVATVARAQDAGQVVRGAIVSVALRETPRRMTVRGEDGVELEAVLATKTRVTFKQGIWRHPRSGVADLQRGMQVEFRWDAERIDRVLVLAVPPGARPGGGYDEPAEPSWGGPKPTPRP